MTVLMILTVFSLFALVGITIANLVLLCAIKRAAAEQLLSTRQHMGQLMRKTMDNETFDTSSDIQKELEKIMSYTGVDHGQ